MRIIPPSEQWKYPNAHALAEHDSCSVCLQDCSSLPLGQFHLPSQMNTVGMRYISGHAESNVDVDTIMLVGVASHIRNVWEYVSGSLN